MRNNCSPVDGRKHVGELPSERRERMKREREGEDSFGPPAGEGPGYIFGPSNYNYYNPADMKGMVWGIGGIFP
jgi:hypothetical protein